MTRDKTDYDLSPIVEELSAHSQGLMRSGSAGARLLPGTRTGFLSRGSRGTRSSRTKSRSTAAPPSSDASRLARVRWSAAMSGSHAAYVQARRSCCPRPDRKPSSKAPES